MNLGITITPARRVFKKLLGSVNHQLITIIIGLDYISKTEVTLPEDFSTTWTPKNKNSTISRSREFSLNATLAWSIDALDSYLTICHRKPSVYQNPKLYNSASGAGQSVSEKFQVLKAHIDSSDVDFQCICALIELGLKWRNKLVHSVASIRIDPSVETILEKNAQYYLDNFQGLSVKMLIDRFNSKDHPRFKEVTSIIRALHKFVDRAERVLLAQLDKEAYTLECLDNHFSEHSSNNQDLRANTGIFCNRSKDYRIKKIVQIIGNHGILKCSPEDSNLDFDIVEKMANVPYDKLMRIWEQPDTPSKKNMLMSK